MHRGDWLHVALCYPQGTIFSVVGDLYQRQTGKAHSVKSYTATSSHHSVLSGAGERRFYFNSVTGYLFLHLQAHEVRQGHSYCSPRGCERVKITASMTPGLSWKCAPNPFQETEIRRQVWGPSRILRWTAPCSQCGAPQVAVTSTPSVKYIRVQIQSVRRADIENYSRLAFIKVNDEVVLFHSRGLLFLVLDARSGTIVGKWHFNPAGAAKVTWGITNYVQTSIKERSIVLVCSRDIAELGPSEMSVFSSLGSAKPVVFHKEGSFAMLGYKGTPRPSWIKICNHAAYQKSASVQYYVPLIPRG